MLYYIHKQNTLQMEEKQMTNEMINAKAVQKEALEAQIKMLKAQVDEIETELQSELDSRQVDSIDTGMFKIFWKLQSRHTFDSKKFKDEMPEVHEKYCEDKVCTYFKVNRAK